MSTIKNVFCKFVQKIHENNSSTGSSFHTSQNYVFPTKPCETLEPDCLRCLRPMSIDSDSHKLAGNPKTCSPCDNGIKPEIKEKWMQTPPPQDVKNEWIRFTSYFGNNRAA